MFNTVCIPTFGGNTACVGHPRAHHTRESVEVQRQSGFYLLGRGGGR